MKAKKEKKRVKDNEKLDLGQGGNIPLLESRTEEKGSLEAGYHVPVLLQETIEGLNIRPDGIYVDCTFGGGGHSRAILEKLGPEGRLIAFDQDEDAKRNLPEDKRVLFIPHNFRHMKRFLQLHGVKGVDGVLADLGVSSFQFDEASRGFSTRFNAQLDMRMDQRQEKTAFDIIGTYSEQELHKLFEQYGEVTNSKTLARTIVEARRVAPIQTIDAFKTALRDIVKGNPNKYFAQVFQALRIEVNDELGALKEMLQQLPQVLLSGGRAAIITFHSLEDRLVKVFFRDGSFETPEENPFGITRVENELRVINKKPIEATDDEIKRNSRSRSAKLRIAEKK
ncbi:16S rRNA (cytosine(1402)-N(4))-methyltransferase RsmH [Chitinophagaceae bacterium LB-8]|uniref:Ribosomal RNA small subunit methyltransferase H n=1 Tax=Paraflavisolibacter caeni TaxID=2982496 RepID=A0A9X2XRW1_9BACT|nr:16S rRNA (cytosine(1402)-N(4))-methyltransferase RsmH [Paraflavisolibacter caeni]MCU7547744.1 16S rRNA (cytosine(1402)-N(4))-methyltransferase RsmH [Paraflavisolibacter caeni]